jgi:hypothetical protein
MKAGHIATAVTFSATFLGVWLYFRLQHTSCLVNQQERSVPLPAEIDSKIASGSSLSSRSRPDNSPITKQSIIDSIHDSIVSGGYYGDDAFAIKKLAEDFSLIARVDDSSHERSTLQRVAIRRFISQRIDGSVTPEQLIRNVTGLRDALAQYLPDSPIEPSLRPLAGYVHGTLKSMNEGRSSLIIATLEEEALTTGDSALIELAGGLKALSMNQNGEVKLSELSEIANDALRESATRHLLLSDYGDRVDTVLSLVAFYLSEDCPIGDDREIAIKVFGRNISAFPEEVSTVILNSPVGIKRDRAIQQMIYRIAGRDMEMALLWVDHIQDQRIKRSALENIKTAENSIGVVEITEPMADPFAPR